MSAISGTTTCAASGAFSNRTTRRRVCTGLSADRGVAGDRDPLGAPFAVTTAPTGACAPEVTVIPVTVRGFFHRKVRVG